MYKIIGSDGEQYGPASAEQLRGWLAENRVNGRTLIQPEGATDWQPLGAFPEFSGAVQSIALPAGPPPANLSAKASNKIAAGICALLIGSFGVHKFLLGYTGAGIIMLLVTLLTCGLGAVVMYVIAIIEGIIYLTKSDQDFYREYIQQQKPWF